MFSVEKPDPVDYYEEEGRDMILQVVSNGILSSPKQPLESVMMPESSGEEHEMKAPKKRAETWAQEETLCLIGLRREIDSQFNMSKSNKHLWELISSRMRAKGFDRSPTMCTDKWRNLFKEFKKARSRMKGGSNGASAKMAYYKELEDLLRRRAKHCMPQKSSATSKMEAYMQFADKDFDAANIPFAPVEATGRSVLTVEGSLEDERHPLAIQAADAVATNGVNPWNWRDTSTNGGDNVGPFDGRVIMVKCGEFSKRIGIDGSREAIGEAVRSAFGIRTKRAFWLEDEDEVVRSFDRDMPVGSYTLHLDRGITVILKHDGGDSMTVGTEETTFYTEEDFGNFLSRRSWVGLQEFGSFRVIHTLDDLHTGGVYQGLRS